MTTGYVVIAGGPEDRIERGEISVFRQVFASRNDALSEIMADVAECIQCDDEDAVVGGDERPEDHCTIYRRGQDGLPFFIACDGLETYYQIEEVEYP